jgi:hypothetical protein
VSAIDAELVDIRAVQGGPPTRFQQQAVAEGWASAATSVPQQVVPSAWSVEKVGLSARTV